MILSCEDVLNFARSETVTLLCCTDVMNIKQVLLSLCTIVTEDDGDSFFIYGEYHIHS